MTQISYQLTALLTEHIIYQVYRGLAYLPDGSTRDVLVKKLRPAVVQDAVMLSHLAGFCDVVRGFQHPNIAPFWDLGQSHGEYYFIREYLPGCSLQDLLTQVQHNEVLLSPAMAIFITQEIVEAIAALHRYRVPGDQPIYLFHGGLSPENIILTRIGGVVVTDPGLDVIFWRNPKMSEYLQHQKGDYLPPESLSGQRPMRRGDTFGVGAILYQMVMQSPLRESSPHWFSSLDMNLPSQRHARMTAVFDQLVQEVLHPSLDQRTVQIDQLRQGLSKSGLTKQAKVQRREAMAYIEALVSQVLQHTAREQLLDIQPPFHLESLLPDRPEIPAPHRRYRPPQYDATSSFHPKQTLTQEEAVSSDDSLAVGPGKTDTLTPPESWNNTGADVELLGALRGDKPHPSNQTRPSQVSSSESLPEPEDIDLHPELVSASSARVIDPTPLLEEDLAGIPDHLTMMSAIPSAPGSTVVGSPESTRIGPEPTPHIQTVIGPEPTAVGAEPQFPLPPPQPLPPSFPSPVPVAWSPPTPWAAPTYFPPPVPLGESVPLAAPSLAWNQQAEPTEESDEEPESTLVSGIPQSQPTPPTGSLAEDMIPPAPQLSEPVALPLEMMIPSVAIASPRPPWSVASESLGVHARPPASIASPSFSSPTDLPIAPGVSTPDTVESYHPASDNTDIPDDDDDLEELGLHDSLSDNSVQSYPPAPPVQPFPKTPETMALPIEAISGYPGLLSSLSSVQPEQGPPDPPTRPGVDIDNMVGWSRQQNTPSLPSIQETVSLPIEQITGSHTSPSSPSARAFSSQDDGLERFGKFVLLERIAFGGMAEVFRARMEGHGGFQKIVALKRILPEYSEDPIFIQMFTDEARIAGSLTHPHIVQIQELGEVDGLYYISMELIDGIDLARVIKIRRTLQKPVPLGVVLDILIPVCKALHYAHTAADLEGKPLHMIHRDVTPHNILISKKGEIKLTDFGIAKAAQNISTTAVGELKGKLSYMSPEQSQGRMIDQRTDIFQVGIVLYETLTLRKMFEGNTDQSVLHKIQQAMYPKPRQIAAYIPEAFEQITLKALAVNPNHRYQTATELEQDLLRLRNTLPPHERNIDIAAFTQEILTQRDQLLADIANNRRPAQLIGQDPLPIPPIPAMPALPSDPLAGVPVAYPSTAHAPGTGTFRSQQKERKNTRLWGIVLIVGMLILGAIVGFFVLSHKPNSPQKAPLSVETRPAGADVLLDGQRIGQTPLKTHIPFDYKPHTLQLIKPGYRPFSHNFKLQQLGDEVDLFLNLPPLPSSKNPPAPSKIPR